MTKCENCVQYPICLSCEHGPTETCSMRRMCAPMATFPPCYERKEGLPHPSLCPMCSRLSVDQRRVVREAFLAKELLAGSGCEIVAGEQRRTA